MIVQEERTSIVLLKFGSHLYGTDTPNSDTDLKGIFMPSPKDIFLGRIPKSINNQKQKAQGEKNTKDDVDKELYSLHYFIKLALAGETAALDMLHAPKDMLIESSDIWHDLQVNRSKFYTKNLKSFVSYARGQAARYGLKGSRLNTAQELLDLLAEYLNTHPGTDKILNLWSILPQNEHARHIEDTPTGIPQYYICGKIIQGTQQVRYTYAMIKGFIGTYGERARQAANNEGIDWKAMSHALRAAYQVKSIFEHGCIHFPLIEAPYLKRVKAGELDFLSNVMPELEYTMELLEKLAEKSTLPETPNHKFWENWLCSTVAKHVKESV